MKTNELMIGDWVRNTEFGKNGIDRIEDVEPRRVWLEHGTTYVPPCYIEPIPITPEILEKNGFVLKPDGWLWCKEEGNEDNDYIFIQFRKGCEEVRLVELNFVNKVLARYKKMYYVHELQHALRLCRIGKEIEL